MYDNQFDILVTFLKRADQNGNSPVLPPEKPKPQPSVIFDAKKFLTYYSLFKIESNTATQEEKQQDFIDEEIEAEIKGIFTTQNTECRNSRG